MLTGKETSGPPQLALHRVPTKARADPRDWDKEHDVEMQSKNKIISYIFIS
jgi:hypothetical protein